MGYMLVNMTYMEHMGRDLLTNLGEAVPPFMDVNGAFKPLIKSMASTSHRIPCEVNDHPPVITMSCCVAVYRTV